MATRKFIPRPPIYVTTQWDGTNLDDVKQVLWEPFWEFTVNADQTLTVGIGENMGGNTYVAQIGDFFQPNAYQPVVSQADWLARYQEVPAPEGPYTYGVTAG